MVVGGVIWLGVIQHPERLALSRSMPEPEGSLHSAVFHDRACPPFPTDQVVSSSHEIYPGGGGGGVGFIDWVY